MTAGIFSSSVILDSNLLLLFVIGSWNPREITRQKRLSGFAFADFLLLTEFLSGFRQIVTTAHILTEVSNLSGSATGTTRESIFGQFGAIISTLDERHIAATSIASTQEFGRYGMTDAALGLLCTDSVLLTADGRLAAHLQRKGLRAFTLGQVRGMRDLENLR